MTTATKQAQPKCIGKVHEVIAYAKMMEAFHRDGESWQVFRIPAGTTGRQFGEFGCCRASERADYIKGGAEFVA